MSNDFIALLRFIVSAVLVIDICADLGKSRTRLFAITTFVAAGGIRAASLVGNVDLQGAFGVAAVCFAVRIGIAALESEPGKTKKPGIFGLPWKRACVNVPVLLLLWVPAPVGSFILRTLFP